ncbi:M48 family metallopeptidase [Orrella sp. NBD-18]|uniref:M48 family metallopeptidase n=1 Tax=Sheuella amnicola TaxID=2707330 RepID=A0A6B2R0E3_9BURK|nr:SprT family zinc-dependent metalloprotease [Sheuella amnicola]NDY83781.1 M48 family metallopeptidase [Sheuella amnicola]HBI82337.1 M48 family peptidase [Alcaligenaceae bacterium]
MSQLDLLLTDDNTPIPDWVIPPAKLAPDTKWRLVKHGDHTVGFVLMRSRRRSIGFVIGDEGLRVTAPYWVTLSQIDAAVIEKMSWILSKLKDWQARKEQLALSHTRWQPGGQLPYLGCKIVLNSGVPGPHIQPGTTYFDGNPDSPQDGQTLWLPLPNDADTNRIRDMTQAWLQSRARVFFDNRINHFLSLTGLTIRQWRLSSAATRWGSCTSDGNIMLNWRLIHFSPIVIDYVIAHELSHLREMNHSQNFWSEVEQLFPDYQTARKMLNRHSPDGVPEI